MIHIGTLYTEMGQGQARLCARVTVGERSTVLWFGVDEKFAPYFTKRADPFVLAVLGTAMRRGLDIRCESPVSARLLYQLQTCYIPALISAGRAKPLVIHAEAVSGAEESIGAAATGFTGGVDSLYTIMQHMPGNVPPGFALTHVTVLNVGAFKGADYRKAFVRACAFARSFAEEQKLELVPIDTNFNEVLQTAMSTNGLHSFAGELPYRIFAAILALSGLFSVYYLATTFPFSRFSLRKDGLDEDITCFDLLTAQSCSTDGVTFYSAGGEASRTRKLVALSDWEPSYRWLHACFSADTNCGECRKCVMAQVVFYCLGKLENYAERYDLKKFYEKKDIYLARALIHTGHVDEEDLETLVRACIEVTPAMERRARILSAAVASTNTYFVEKGADGPFRWNK